MAKTISTHNGSVARREHNIRNPKVVDKQDHIDKSLSDGNETLIDEHPRLAYKRIFGPALDEYNARQTRPERRIKDYYSHIDADQKKHPVYEMIVQVGDRNNTGINAPVERAVIKEFIHGWTERNPNLELIGAYIHADERDGTLHAHLDYIPVAHGYKNGLHTQNGLVKALGEQGIDTMKRDGVTAQIRWEARENKVLEDICNVHGIEVEHPKRERKHLATPEYKEVMAEVESLRVTRDTLKNDVNMFRERAEDVSRVIEADKKDMESLRKERGELKNEIKALNSRLLNEREILLLKGKKTLTGALKGVKYEDYEAALRTAAQAGRYKAERDREARRADAAERRAVEAEKKAEEAANESPSMMLQIEHRNLQYQLARMKGRLKKLLDVVPEQFGAIKNAIGNILRDREPFRQDHMKGRGHELER